MQAAAPPVPPFSPAGPFPPPSRGSGVVAAVIAAVVAAVVLYVPELHFASLFSSSPSVRS